MKNLFFFLPVIVFVYSCGTEQTANDDISGKVNRLVSQMTLKEKVGQMTEVTIDVLLTKDSDGEKVVLDDSMVQKIVVDYGAGSVLNTPRDHARTPEQWYAIQNRIQKAVRKTRLKIPVLYGIDAIHGATYTTGGIGYTGKNNSRIVQRIKAPCGYIWNNLYAWVYNPSQITVKK